MERPPVPIDARGSRWITEAISPLYPIDYLIGDEWDSYFYDRNGSEVLEFYYQLEIEFQINFTPHCNTAQRGSAATRKAPLRRSPPEDPGTPFSTPNLGGDMEILESYFLSLITLLRGGNVLRVL